MCNVDLLNCQSNLSLESLLSILLPKTLYLADELEKIISANLYMVPF